MISINRLLTSNSKLFRWENYFTQLNSCVDKKSLEKLSYNINSTERTFEAKEGPAVPVQPGPDSRHARHRRSLGEKRAEGGSQRRRRQAPWEVVTSHGRHLQEVAR